MKNEFLLQRLHAQKQKGLFRQLSLPKAQIDFASNDYLGFAHSSELNKLVEAEVDTMKRKHGNGLGSTGSRLLTGNSEYAEALELFIADFHHAEAGLLFNSGYTANTGLLSSVAKKEDVILYDELSHASIYDGVRLSKANSFPFKHNDVIHLEDRLKFLRDTNQYKGEILVVVESVYSMDGDFAPLVEIDELCRKHDARLVVDEAHATGIFGNRGEGRVVEFGLEKNIFARIHTFGKALGCHGAIVLGSKALIEYLVNFSRPFIYTTALPFHSLAVIKATYTLLTKSSNKIIIIHQLINLFTAIYKEKKLPYFLPSTSPIQSLVVAGNEQVKELAKNICSDGYDVRPIFSPTVSKGKERIRICLHAFNKEEEITGLFTSIMRHTSQIPANILTTS